MLLFGYTTQTGPLQYEALTYSVVGWTGQGTALIWLAANLICKPTSANYYYCCECYYQFSVDKLGMLRFLSLHAGVVHACSVRGSVATSEKPC